MNVISLFTGVGGLDLGLERAGHRIVAQCEADANARKVLRRHWPDVPIYEDVVGYEPTESADLVCGGFPCQDLSVAGRRAGLAGERSGLFFEAARISDLVLGDGGWLLIENVPGVLSSNDGRDFAIVLATLAELGFFDLAWRVLDSRYFGVPQRRRRVFLLARRSRGRRSAEVLLEPEGGGRDYPKGRASGEESARESSGGPRTSGSGPGLPNEGIAGTLTKRYGKGVNTTFDDGAVALCPPPYADGVRTSPGLPGRVDDPVTCAYDPKPDGPRYAQMGNAVTVNVAEWIGHRLREFG